LSQPRRSRMGKGGRRLQDKPTGKLIALQIKSGESFFKKRGNIPLLANIFQRKN
jgi:hypothetical protein